MENKTYKELEIILSSFRCNKNCPYCTAKITKWDQVEDNVRLLSFRAEELKRLGYTFHYLTIGGNGEPTMHDYAKIKTIVDAFKDYDIPVKRVLTSGYVFRPEAQKVFDLLNNAGYYFEVTVTSFDLVKDKEILGYDLEYFNEPNFKKAKIRLNYVMLESNRNSYIEDMKKFIDKYDNIEVAAVKLLNVNTKTGLVDNPLSEWIIKNGVSKHQKVEIKKELDDNFKYKEDKFDTFSWEYHGKEIYFSWKNKPYGFGDLVWYGDKFVDYSLEEKQVAGFRKVYIASKFIKNTHTDGSFDLLEDFREQLLAKSNSSLIDSNNKSFIQTENGETLHYIGPFYNEIASNGELTSTECNEVVSTELSLIDDCDLFIVYMDENISPGSITELMYAAMKKKDIVIMFKVDESIRYTIKTDNWFPIVSAMQLSEADIKIMPVTNEEEVKKLILAMD